MGKRIVIALGGNALGSTPYEQLALVTETAKPIVDLIEQGNEVVIAHGNGPQVGMINLGMATAAEAGAIKSDMPFPECGAMSEGYIGYHLQQAIGNELSSRGMTKPVATIVTQTVVSENDPAFQNPTKPVGAFYDKATADRIAAEKGYTMVEDAGRGYRQVVPSPKPFDIVEAESIKALFNAGHVVIAVGGGVVGDLAGFAASIYMRGIDFINCPTTTLSMIDSSIGGKTAVDLGETKNIVGSFWQPKLVIVDPSTLATLPRRQYINGLAESVKASLLADPELFAIFEKGDIDEQIGEIIYRSLRFKKSIVEQDETEHGMRKALNFGHTIGHGIEAVKGVKGRRTVGLYHGECVALGMLPMIESKALQKRVRAVYRRLGLPLRTAYNKDKVYAEMLHDKKAQGGQITVIKVPGLGCWRAETIPVEGLRPLLGMED